MGWGDELMVTGHARELQARDPRKVRPTYERQRDHEAWLHNPRIAGKNEGGDVQIYLGRVNGLRPYMTFKDSDRYGWKPYGPPVGELYFSAEELEFGARWKDLVVLEPNVKPGASPNKDWGFARWRALARLLKERGIAAAQIGPYDARKLPGVQFIETRTVRHAAALLRRARGAVLPEGALHHCAAAVNCPAVVLFGGFISPAVTGYAGQASLFVQTPAHPLGCGWRRPCEHCAAAMASFTPASVLQRLEEVLHVPAPGHLAA